MDYNTNTPNYNTKQSKIANFRDFNDNIKQEEEDLEEVDRSFLDNEEKVGNLPNLFKDKFNRVTRKNDTLSRPEIDDKIKAIKSKGKSLKESLTTNDWDDEYEDGWDDEFKSKKDKKIKKNKYDEFEDEEDEWEDDNFNESNDDKYFDKFNKLDKDETSLVNEIVKLNKNITKESIKNILKRYEIKKK